MKRAFLDDARPEDVAHAVRRVVEQRGGLVAEHVRSRVRFTAHPQGKAWLRDGYVGLYQPLGESSVELRLLLRARWPWRLFWGVALANLVLAALLVALNPDGNTWFLAAFVGGFALLVAGLVHLNTLLPVREEEKAWLEAFEAELRQELPTSGLEDDVAREQREAELALEGEVTQLRLDKARRNAPRAEKGKRFSLRPGKNPPAEESADEKRARLLARKAELEARQREQP